MTKLARQFVDLLSVTTAQYDAARPFLYGTKGGSASLVTQLHGSQDYAGIAALLEAIAAADSMLLHLTPSPRPENHMRVIGAQIQAAHWYGKCGEAELGTLAAKRAMTQASRLIDRTDLFQGYDAIYRSYLMEMMGDAAAVYDQELARTQYNAAMDGFATVSEDDQLAEGNEYFPGGYLYHMVHHFMTDGHQLRWMLAEERIPAKIKEWLES